jgi:hypothetical protein
MPITVFTSSYAEWCKENQLSSLGGRRIKQSLIAKKFEPGQKKIGQKNTKVWFGLKISK